MQLATGSEGKISKVNSERIANILCNNYMVTCARRKLLCPELCAGSFLNGVVFVNFTFAKKRVGVGGSSNKFQVHSLEKKWGVRSFNSLLHRALHRPCGFKNFTTTARSLLQLAPSILVVHMQAHWDSGHHKTEPESNAWNFAFVYSLQFFGGHSRDVTVYQDLSNCIHKLKRGEC